MSNAKKLSDSAKEAITLWISALIICSGVAFACGVEYTKHQIRASYCASFNDPRCK